MIIKINIPAFLVKLHWFLLDLCGECGGELEQHINGKHYCKNCNKKN